MSISFDLPSFEVQTFDKSILRDLRSDHAGETGAVYIYKGILSVTRDDELRKFSLHHLETEKKHLKFFEDWLPDKHKSSFLPLWRISGYALGKFPAMLGPRWVYITIDIVESFVTKHYQNQISKLNDAQHDEYLLKVILKKFKDDEGHHETDAKNRIDSPLTFIERMYQYFISVGSSLSVKIARII